MEGYNKKLNLRSFPEMDFCGLLVCHFGGLVEHNRQKISLLAICWKSNRSFTGLQVLLAIVSEFVMKPKK